MDLLGGYGSGSDSEPDSPQVAAGNTGTATLLQSSPLHAPAVPAEPAAFVDPSQLLSKLPAPSGAKVGGHKRLTCPARRLWALL